MTNTVTIFKTSFHSSPFVAKQAMLQEFVSHSYWQRFLAIGLAAFAAMLLAGCEAKPTQPVTSTPPNEVKKKPFCEVAAQIEFQEVAKQSGVVFQYEDGGSAKLFTMPETIGGGVAVWDFDLDGNLDLAFAGGGSFGPQDRQITGRPLALFRNGGGLQFQEVTAASHTDEASGYSHGTIVGDYNADGFPDLLITGFGGLQLWKNLGDGTFENATTQAGLSDNLWSTSAAFADFNGDGHADLYVAHYVNWSFDNHPLCPASNNPEQRDFCSPRAFEPLSDTLYFGNGDGTFRDGSKEAGLVDGGKGLGVIASDLDNDGDVDIYVANDTTANFLYLNDGKGHFKELGELNGAAVDDSGTPNGSMGVDIVDYNQDGLPDIWVANFERESFALYANLGDGAFLHSSRTTGIAALNELYVAFGTQTNDFDLDGDEDFVVTNGHILQFPTGIGRKQEPLLLLNDKGFFRRAEFAPNSFFSQLHEGRGLAAGDLDNDGDFDVAISHINEPVALLRNERISSLSPQQDPGTKPGHSPNWISLQLIGTKTHRDAVGSRIILHTSKGDITRWQRGGCSYCSSPAPQVHFGIPPRAEVTGLTIHWPSGEKQELPAPKLNAQTKLLEPTSP